MFTFGFPTSPFSQKPSIKTVFQTEATGESQPEVGASVWTVEEGAAGAFCRMQ